MTVKVNDSCIGCGACESICDAVFSVDGTAQLMKLMLQITWTVLKKQLKLAQ